MVSGHGTGYSGNGESTTPDSSIQKTHLGHLGHLGHLSLGAFLRNWVVHLGVGHRALGVFCEAGAGTPGICSVGAFRPNPYSES